MAEKAVAEALVFVPHVKIVPDINGGRKLVSTRSPQE